MNTHLRLLCVRLVTAGPKMSTKTKPPSHYETLEINNDATQSEIKAAYFKLSKEYHPDKNRSKAATTKFRDITEAYEVLGNFTARKAYDRSLLTHANHNVPQSKPKEYDPRMQHYRSQAGIFKETAKTGSSPIFDFDAWTKAHYGNVRQRKRQDAYDAAMMRQAKEEEDRTIESGMSYSTAYVILFSTALLFLLVMTQQRNYDNPSLYLQKNNSNGNKATSESSSTK